MVYFLREDLAKFAKLVAAHEREENAKICDDMENYRQDECYATATEDCANAIRAMGEQVKTVEIPDV